MSRNREDNMVTLRDGVWFLLLMAVGCVWYADHAILSQSNAHLRGQLDVRAHDIEYLKARLIEANNRLQPGDDPS